MRLFGVGPVLGFQLKSDYEGAQAAFKSASPDKIYIDLSDAPMTEHEFEKAFGVKRCTVHYYKVGALEKLREMLSENV